MAALTQEEIKKILTEIELKERASVLGYFSQPFRVYHGERPLFIKLYFPVKNLRVIESIIKNHDDYVRELRFAGLKIPETSIISRPEAKKHRLIIIQDAFKDEELLRNRIIKAGVEEVKSLCIMVFDEMLRFREKKNKHIDIGFHPTLRNYSVHEGELWFFDTFPPMLMNQKDLNRLILKMSPYGGLLKKIIPLRLINKVTDEYYHIDRMFTGVVGSCCRLRPDDSDFILSFSREYVNQSNSLSVGEKKNIFSLLKKPPQLSGIWILIRKMSGNTGKPNINTPISA
ncbi:MAG TPA: hypothetical protein DDW27_02085 [Bacteroidales bacterium]|nr:hypothetical protein [Bacteroidales bacterium]